MAALLQVAEALDFSRTRSTTVQAVEGADGPRAELTVGGPQAGMDAQQAAARAGLWYQLFKQEIVFTTVEAELAAAVVRLPDEPVTVPPPAPPVAPPPAAETPAVPPMLPDEAMSEAGRKAMYTHFLKMLANEAGTRLGEDIEALHDMRVSTRRMRAAYRIFADYYDQKIIAPFNKGLRRTGAMLGAVRDLDVLLEKAQAWEAERPERSRSWWLPWSPMAAPRATGRWSRCWPIGARDARLPAGRCWSTWIARRIAGLWPIFRRF